MMHLNCRTSYSFMRGFGDQSAWSTRSKEINSKYVVADYCSTWAHPFFMGHAGLGVQLPIVTALSKTPDHALGTIIAFNREGLGRLYELVSLASDQSYYRPRVTWAQIHETMGDYGTLLVDGASPSLLAGWMEENYGYLALGLNKSFFWDLAEELPACIAMGPQFPRPGDRKLFEVVKAVGRNHQAGELDGSGTHMLGRADLDAGLKDMQERARAVAWSNTGLIADRIDFCSPRAAPMLNPDHLPSLDEMIVAGLADRFPGAVPLEYAERLERELEVINAKSFSDYFRFVADVVRYAKSNFLVGPGRGSSGGSLLCYILGITDVDPIRHGTMFARFIDPSRPDLPDIDVDFPDIKRDDVFSYLRKQYGADQVAKLGTVSTWHAASALNDVARVQEIDRDDLRALKAIAEQSDVTLGELCVTDAGARAIAESNPAVLLAARLEGMPRHSGVHPAGILVSNTPLCEFGAVSGKGVLSVDGASAERLGLLKFDALGLRTLTVIQQALELAGLEPTDYHNLLRECYDGAGDPKVYEKIFQADRVTGIFQFEGPAVRQLAKKIVVSEFSDLCALTSLARPGPLYSGQADRWCATHNGEIEAEYLSDEMREVTVDTYGQIVYQEQAMEVVRRMAGFDDSEVNQFRKAMGKKVPEDMAAMREKFVSGYRKRALIADERHTELGIDTEAGRMFDMLEEYSGYAFNKSHAVAYSMITYVTAWLKCHYPKEFVCAQLRNQDDEHKTKGLLRDLTAEGIEYVPFDLETSEENWSIQGDVVVGGFTAVRGIGKKTAEACIKRRAADPEGWTQDLTAAQRSKLLSPYNTPWHDLTRMSEVYAPIYVNPKMVGVRHDLIQQIDDIPEVKGSYVFLGKLTKAVERENKSGHTFINLYFEDDSGDCGVTINRFKAGGYKHLLEAEALDKDYLVRADLIEDGRKWFFLDKLKIIGG